MSEHYIGPIQRKLMKDSRPDGRGVSYKEFVKGFQAKENFIYSPELAKKYLELGNLVSEKMQKGNLEQTKPPHADIGKVYKDQYKGFSENQSVYVYMRNPKSEEQVEKIKLEAEGGKESEVKVTGKVWVIDKDSEGKEKAKCYYLGEGGKWYLQEAEEKTHKQEKNTTEWKLNKATTVSEKDMNDVFKVFDTLKAPTA